MGAGKTAVTSQETTGVRAERVAFQALPSGSYLLEVVRAVPSSDTTPVRGTITVVVVGERKQVPFVLSGNRMELGRVEVSYQSRLVPAW